MSLIGGEESADVIWNSPVRLDVILGEILIADILFYFFCLIWATHAVKNHLEVVEACMKNAAIESGPWM